jgi:hypothetical protein
VENATIVVNRLDFLKLFGICLFCKKAQQLIGKPLRTCNILDRDDKEKMGEKWVYARRASELSFRGSDFMEGFHFMALSC